MPYGYTGNILHLHLNSKKYWTENPAENFYRTYWGGRSLALYCMLKKMKPKIDLCFGILLDFWEHRRAIVDFM